MVKRKPTEDSGISGPVRMKKEMEEFVHKNAGPKPVSWISVATSVDSELKARQPFYNRSALDFKSSKMKF